MSLSGGESRWNSPQYTILRRKPMMRVRKNPSKKSLLLNVMPVSTDPGLSPSTSTTRSPTSHRSSWSSTSELEHPLGGVSFRQGVKIDQLLKVNEAIAFELADLESGKERWLEKLKLLEARICSNIVNIDKWATENKSKPVNIQAIDTGAVHNKMKESSVSEVPLAWRLSLADLASIFKSTNVEHSNRLPPQHQRHGRALSCGVDFNFDGHEGIAAVSKEGSNIVNGASKPLLANGAIDVVISSLKGSEMSQKDANSTPEQLSEAPKVVLTGGKTSISKEATDGLKGDAADVESVEVVSRAGNNWTRRIKTSENLEDRLALNDKNCSLTGLELMSEAIPGSKTVEARVGSPGVAGLMSSVEQGTNGIHQFSRDISSMLEEETHSQMGHSQTELSEALIKAKKQFQELKQHTVTIEREKANLESTLRDCKHALEEAMLDARNLRLQKEELQGMLTDCKTSSESARLVLMEEKDEKERKLLSSVQSLEEIQQKTIVLERQKLVFESELNHFRQAFEKAKQEALGLKKEKTAIELDFTACKQTLREAEDNAVLLQKERDRLARESSEIKENLGKYQHRCLMLEKAKDELQDSLTESKHAFEKAVEKYTITESEKSNLEAAYDELKQQAWMLEDENNGLETVLVECKHTLEGTQQQVMLLEGEKDYLIGELSGSKQAFEEERQHALLLEEEKMALEIGSCEYKQIIQETEQHVLTLQSALEGTLQRADALDNQVQRLHIEIKRLGENNEKLLALKHEQEAKCRDLEAQREVLQAELGGLKSKQEAAEEALAKINSVYATAIEDTEQQKVQVQALQHRQSLIEEENASLKVSLEDTMQKSKLLEAEQNRLQLKLKDNDCSLHKVLQELDALSLDHANEVAALRIEVAGNECQIQELMEQVQQKTVELERLCQVEALNKDLSEKLNGQELQLRSTTSQLESVKLELAGKRAELEDERSAKDTVIKELDAIVIKLSDLEKELSRVRVEQAGLRGALKGEVANKKELVQKLHAEQAHSRELAAALEFAKLEQNDILVHLEDERMAKEAALEEMEAIKCHSEELEKYLHKLQAEVQVRGRENEDNESLMQALLEEERSKCRELEEALDLKTAEQEDTDVAWEGERHVNEVLLRELEQERRQRMQLEEELKVSKAKEEHTVVALQDERAALKNLKQHIDTQETRYKELETAFNLARIEQQRREQETLPKLQELGDQANSCLEQERCKVMADDETVHAALEIEKLRLDVSEVIAKSKRLEQMLSSLEKEHACSSSNDAIRSAVTEELRKLQSCVQHIESRLVDARHMMSDEGKGKEKEEKKNEDELLALLEESSTFRPGAPGLEAQIPHDGGTSTDVAWQAEKGKEKEEKKNEDELLALLEESSTFRPRAPGLEAQIPHDGGTPIDVARQAEEEIRRLKESTETFHQALFDAHHTAIADVAGLLVELKSLKRLLNDKSMVGSDKKEEKKRASLSIPTAALSTSALAALGLLALMKLPKSTIRKI